MFVATFGYASVSTPQRQKQSLFGFGPGSFTESPASGAASAGVAPAALPNTGQMVYRVFSDVACYIALGSAPAPAASPRAYVKAGEYYDIECQPGDKIAWVAA